MYQIRMYQIGSRCPSPANPPSRILSFMPAGSSQAGSSQAALATMAARPLCLALVILVVLLPGAAPAAAPLEAAAEPAKQRGWLRGLFRRALLQTPPPAGLSYTLVRGMLGQYPSHDGRPGGGGK